MRFTEAERQQRCRENKKLRGVKEIRGVYVKAENYEETKQKAKDYIKNLEGE